MVEKFSTVLWAWRVRKQVVLSEQLELGALLQAPAVIKESFADMPKDMLGRGADRDNPLQIDMGNFGAVPPPRRVAPANDLPRRSCRSSGGQICLCATGYLRTFCRSSSNIEVRPKNSLERVTGSL